MGRRKSKRGPGPKKRREPLDAIFDCPFCNHEKSCEVNMDKGKGCCSRPFNLGKK